MGTDRMRVTAWFWAASIGLALALGSGAAAAAANVKMGLELPMPPKPIKRVDPVYPPQAEAAGVIGRADGAFTITEAGTVKDVTIYSGFPAGLGFGPAAQAAVELWQYPPHHAGRYRLKMKFRLEEDAPTLQSGSPTPLAVDHRPNFHPPYPPLAEAMEIKGEATIICQIDENGVPSHLFIKDEQPADWGFAESAHNYVLALKFKGEKTGTYTMTIRYRLN